MEICIVVIVLVVVVVLIVFGLLILTVLVSILQVVSVVIVDGLNSIKRSFWKRKVGKLEYNDSKVVIKEQKQLLAELKSIETALVATKIPTDGIQSQMIDYRVEFNRTKITDAEAKLSFLSEITKEYEVLERKQRLVEIADFTKTADYELIKRFAKKFQDVIDESSFNQLLTLLESKGQPFEPEDLKELVTKEQKALKVEDAISKILETSPESKREILESYLSNYKDDDLELIALEKILNEKGLFKGSTAELQAELEVVAEQIKMEQFEKGLLD